MSNTKTEVLPLVDKSNAQSITDMLKSSDEDSRTLAFEVLESSDIDNSKVEILCILKDTYETAFKGKSLDEKFKASFPRLFSFLTDALVDETKISNLTFRRMYEICCEVDKEESTNFLLDACNKEFREALEGFGFDFLKYLDIHFTIKKQA